MIVVAAAAVVGQCQSNTCVRELDFQCKAHKAKAALLRRRRLRSPMHCSSNLDPVLETAMATAAAAATAAATSADTCATLREAGKQVWLYAGKRSVTLAGGEGEKGHRLGFFGFGSARMRKFAMRQHAFVSWVVLCAQKKGLKQFTTRPY